MDEKCQASPDKSRDLILRAHRARARCASRRMAAPPELAAMDRDAVRASLGLLLTMRAARTHSLSAPPAERQVLHHLELDLLNFGEPLPLPRDDVVDLVVQVADFKLGLEVDLVVVLRTQPILRLLPLL